MKPFTKTVLASLVALVGLAAVKSVLAFDFTVESSGLDVAAGALYGRDSGVSSDLISIVGGAINAVLGLVGAFFLVLIVYSGSLWMTSRGNQEQIKRAQNTMTSAVIGIIIVMGSYTMTDFVLTQILGATGYGSDTDQIIEAPDAVNRPTDLNESCPAYNECLNDPANAGFNPESLDLICKSKCGDGTAATCDQAAYDECMTETDDEELCQASSGCEPVDPNYHGGVECTVEDQINYEACIKGGEEKDTCSLMNGGCNYEVTLTDADKTQQLNDCWKNDCAGKPYNDQACIEKCGGSPVPMAEGSMDSGNCMDDCINKYKHSIAACNASCESGAYGSCITACENGGKTSVQCEQECEGEKPNPNPTGLVGGYEDCVTQCVSDPDNPKSQTQCQQTCTGVEAENPLVSDTCYADCFADKPIVSGVPLNYASTAYYCNKTCLNLGIISPAVDEACWEANANVTTQVDRLKLCMVDNVCMDLCLKLKTHDECVPECLLSHYE